MTRLKFGAFVPQGFMLDLLSVPPGEQWPVMVSHAQVIESLGYDSLWASDHLHNAPWIDHYRSKGEPKMSAPVFECWTLIAALSQHTSRVRLGQLTTANTFRAPALLAKTAATVDVMSGGRLEVGMGAGWFEREHLGYGIPFPSTRTRIGMLGESLEILRRFWSEHEVSFEGQHYEIKCGRCNPKPLQDHLPILVGGSGPSTLKIVAKWADKWNFLGQPEPFPETVAKLQEECERVGRDFGSIEKTWFDTGVVVGETEADALRMITSARELKGIPDERSWLWGTPDRLIEVFGELAALGVTEFVPQFVDYPNTASLELFAAEVIPALTKEFS
jgi:F420-dependent oxidoreductase-like protein